MGAATGRTMAGEIQLADRVMRINVSPTLAVLQEAERFKARGVDVVDFGPGEPDFPTPDHIKRAAIKALEENKTKYTPTAGIAPLAAGHLRLAHSAIRLLLSARRMIGYGGRQARHLQRGVLARESRR